MTGSLGIITNLLFFNCLDIPFRRAGDGGFSVLEDVAVPPGAVNAVERVGFDRRDNLAVLVVEDDGIGFDPANRDLVDRGIGLAGMRQRAALANATLQVESSPGKGTAVFLRCPVDRPDGAGT